MVLQLFVHAVEVYGLPERVRCNRGTENYDLGYYMLIVILYVDHTVEVLLRVKVSTIRGLKGGGVTSFSL